MNPQTTTASQMATPVRCNQIDVPDARVLTPTAPPGPRSCLAQIKDTKKTFVKEDLSEGKRIERAFNVELPIDKVLVCGEKSPAEYFKLVAETKSVSQKPTASPVAPTTFTAPPPRAQTNVRYLVALFPPFVSAAMRRIRMAAQRLTGRMAKNMAFRVAPNATAIIYSETGGNKSGAISHWTNDLSLYFALTGIAPFSVTDCTTESLRASMADNDGSTILCMHEAKRLMGLDRYKPGAGDGRELMMEGQVRCVRPSPPTPPRASDTPRDSPKDGQGWGRTPQRAHRDPPMPRMDAPRAASAIRTNASARVPSPHARHLPLAAAAAPPTSPPPSPLPVPSQDGVEGRTVRKGGPDDDDDDDDDDRDSGNNSQKKKKKTAHYVSITPHLDIAGATHPQLAARTTLKEQEDPVGAVIRQLMAVIPAEVYPLPSAARLDELLEQLNGCAMPSARASLHPRDPRLRPRPAPPVAPGALCRHERCRTAQVPEHARRARRDHHLLQRRLRGPCQPPRRRVRRHLPHQGGVRHAGGVL